VVLIPSGINKHKEFEPMFIDNKYTQCYYRIIENRRANPFNGYVEKHHIVPKSLGGNNKKENLIALTSREHFICHRLLVKMTEGKNKVKMAYAIRMMMRLENPYQDRYKINARLYASLLKITKPVIGQHMTGGHNPFFGEKHTEKTREKMRGQRALQVMRKDWKHTEVTKDKLREANKKQFEDSTQIELRRKKSKELWADPEWRSKYKGNTGKKWYTNGIDSKLIADITNIPAGWIPGRLFKKGGETI
jgi:hypothetical protein